MTRIGLLSDTHCYLDPSLENVFADCNEIWHAGDIGNGKVLDTLQKWKPIVRAVSGNIDGAEIRLRAPQELIFEIEHVKVLLLHIGGYPGVYPPRIRKKLIDAHPAVFVCGHSHILRVMYDNQLQLLHINPGASGKEGFHKVRTAIRFTVDGKDIRDMEVIELGMRGAAI